MRAAMIVLVVSDLQRQRAALRIAHHDVVHAQAGRDRGDVRERHDDDVRRDAPRRDRA